jgi:hypothetical protein
MTRVQEEDGCPTSVSVTEVNVFCGMKMTVQSLIFRSEWGMQPQVALHLPAFTGDLLNNKPYPVFRMTLRVDNG